jgi:hypothetical protein
MDESVRIILGIAAGAALLYLGSRIRSRARTRPGRKKDGPIR